jgi:hypothetical protein
MNRLLKITALFATVVSLSLLANDAWANSKATQKQGDTNISSKLQKQQGTGQGTGSTTQPSQPTKPSLVYRVPPGGWKAIGSIFNQPTKPTFPYHIPPGGWKAIGSFFNQPTSPTPKPTPTQPPKGTGYGFSGGYFGGGTVTNTVATTTATVADQTAAPAQAATDSDSANEVQIAVGSTFT